MLMCVCSLVYHRRPQNVLRTSVTHLHNCQGEQSTHLFGLNGEVLLDRYGFLPLLSWIDYIILLASVLNRVWPCPKQGMVTWSVQAKPASRLTLESHMWAAKSESASEGIPHEDSGAEVSILMAFCIVQVKSCNNWIFHASNTISLFGNSLNSSKQFKFLYNKIVSFPNRVLKYPSK